MARRSPRIAALALVLAVPLAACGDDDDDGAVEPAGQSTTTTAPDATTTTVPAGGTIQQTATTVAPPGVVIDIEVVGGEPVGGSVGQAVPLGEHVTIRVLADVADEVHVHGYDLLADVGPDTPGVIEFTADIPGQFEVELEGSGTLLAELTVS